jgi:hypothetical protein
MHDIEMHEVLDEFSRCRVERPTANEQNRGSVPRDSKTAARSMLALDFGSPRCSKRSFNKPEVRLTKNGSISIAYEFCTKSAKS